MDIIQNKDILKEPKLNIKKILRFLLPELREIIYKYLYRPYKSIYSHTLFEEYAKTKDFNVLIDVVLNNEDRIEYVAAEPSIVKQELNKLFFDIEKLRRTNLNTIETMFFASFIHLVFVKIHPLQDGNGRMARLIEKWFLFEKLGDKGVPIGLEKNYYNNLSDYYRNIKKLGVEYVDLDYSKSLDFLKMTINGLITQGENH